MKNKILQKRFTMNYLLVFTGIIFLLFYSNPCSAQNKKTAESYKTYVKQADKAYAALDFKNALELYEKASKAMPEYNYPTNKINEIKKILEANADSDNQSSSKTLNSNASYKSLIAKANYEYDNKDYATALLFYDKAYKTRPEYYYAPDKIDEINAILNAAPETKTRIFEQTLSKAESSYEQQNYKLAKSEYEKASLVDTAAQLPKERLRQISSVYTDPDDMGNFKLAVANGDKALALFNYNQAILFYEAATKMHPKSKFVNEKITDTKIQQIAYKAKMAESAIAVAAVDKQSHSELPDKVINTKDPVKAELPAKVIDTKDPVKAEIPAIAKNPKVVQTEIPAKVIDLKETPVAVKTGESQIQAEQAKYDAALAIAENTMKSADFATALVQFKSASSIKPSEKYPQLKITEIEKMLAEKASRKELDEKYAFAIASGDQFLSTSKYTEALSAYKQALSIKPNESYPATKTAEINTLLAKQKSDSENYAQAIRTGDKALAAVNYNLALTSFLNAEKIKPTEAYPKQQLIEIKALIAAQQNKDEKYNKAITSADQLFSTKEYSGALVAYTEAANIKKNEKYPQDQIFKINKLIADLHPVDESYTLAISEGDNLFLIKDYSGAISAFGRASAIKPTEAYPPQRITEINKIMEETKRVHTAEYNKALEVADKLYITKVYDQAIEAYENAAKINPGDAYPELQISKIRKYMSDHAILDLNSQALTISRGNEKKFAFSAIDPSLRKNNYILIKARSTGNSVPKVYLNYGKDDSKNGGIVLRSIGKYTLSDLLISISGQDKWFREENNWLSISVETGEIEITRVQIAAGE